MRRPPPGDPGGWGAAPLEDGFPPGDGGAQDAASAHCPCCGERVTLWIDPAGGARQDYVEDCPVCCRPWRVRVCYDPDGSAQVSVTAEDET